MQITEANVPITCSIRGVEAKVTEVSPESNVHAVIFNRTKAAHRHVPPILRPAMLVPEDQPKGATFRGEDGCIRYPVPGDYILREIIIGLGRKKEDYWMIAELVYSSDGVEFREIHTLCLLPSE